MCYSKTYKIQWRARITLTYSLYFWDEILTFSSFVSLRMENWKIVFSCYFPHFISFWVFFPTCSSYHFSIFLNTQTIFAHTHKFRQHKNSLTFSHSRARTTAFSLILIVFSWPKAQWKKQQKLLENELLKWRKQK